MKDRVRLAGIEVFAYHGVFPEEKDQGQLFVIDVEIEIDLQPASVSDELEDTLDYGLLASEIHDLVARERWNLIERVAGRVADLVLEKPLAAAVTVTVHKPHAPVDVTTGDISVTLHRAAR